VHEPARDQHELDRHQNHQHGNGDRPELESPYWEQLLYQYANVDDEGRIILSLEDSVRLAVLHSPDYQRQIETLYLSALDVSTERFRFDVQFFGGNITEFTHLGQLRPGGESNTLSLDHHATLHTHDPDALPQHALGLRTETGTRGHGLGRLDETVIAVSAAPRRERRAA
jgi:hypothetical protein